MAEETSVPLTTGIAETVLPPDPAAWTAELAAALESPPDARKREVAAVAGRHPRMLAAWAELAELADDPVESYAYARVGYHRGLDALRGSGWRGSGYVRWREESNGGFLRSLALLAVAAGEIGELDEQERCELFLRQLDPTGAGAGED